jgi:hypothetical protein
VIQLLYVSSARPDAEIDADALLATARRNNRMLGVTGLLYFEGKRFLQVLEGRADQVERIFTRIQGDPRHRALVTLARREIVTREFGDWAMAYCGPEDDASAFITQVRDRVQAASSEVRGVFEGLAEARRAA